MKETRISRRRCPRCGWSIARIPRRPEDRIASETAPIRRYRCCYPGGCGWEGTLGATSADKGVERRRAAKLVRVRMPRATNRRFALCGVIAVAALALCGAGLTVYGTYAPTSWRAENARAIPFGVSDFGRPLPEDHPFLQQDVDAQPRAVNTASAGRASSAGATTEPHGLGNPAASSDDAPLRLREDCAWGEPGRSPYQGTIRQALKAARLPEEVVAVLERKIRDREASDRLEIRNDRIRGVHSNALFEPAAIKMTYGKTLCLNSRVNFNLGHVELADLYEVADARGITYSVMVPYVCGNVSVLGARARRDEKPQHLPTGKPEQSWTTNREGVQNLVDVTPPLGVNYVPEPETWTLMLIGIALFGWFTRR